MAKRTKGVANSEKMEDIKRQLDALSEKLKQCEKAFPDIPTCCRDGLRLSQEVEILQRRNNELMEENTRLRQMLERIPGR